MKIYLVRHGEPLVAHNQKANLLGYAKWRRSYHHASIKPDKEKAAQAARKIDGQAKYFSSDLKRAIHTAAEIIHEAEITKEKVFREMELPLIALPITAKYSSWLVLGRLLWFCGLGGRGESFKQAKARMRRAVARLSEEAKTQDVVLFGHGMMNYFIAKELKRSGWRGVVPPKLKYWEVVRLEKKV
jgi:broad specificity phosphatase PhoE